MTYLSPVFFRKFAVGLSLLLAFNFGSKQAECAPDKSGSASLPNSKAPCSDPYSAEIFLKKVACLACLRKMEKVIQRHEGVLRVKIFYQPANNTALAVIRYNPKQAHLSDFFKIIETETQDYQVRSNKLEPNTASAAATKQPAGHSCCGD